MDAGTFDHTRGALASPETIRVCARLTPKLLLLVAFVTCAIVLLAFAASTLASSGGCGGG